MSEQSILEYLHKRIKTIQDIQESQTKLFERELKARDKEIDSLNKKFRKLEIAYKQLKSKTINLENRVETTINTFASKIIKK